MRRHVERVMAAAHRAKALINQILTYSRSTRGKRHVMRICEAVDEVLLLVRASLPADVELRTRLAAPEARVMADATQVHQLLMNLSLQRRARHAFWRRARRIAVETIDTFADRTLSHGLLPAGRYVRLSVADTGSGMDADDRAARRSSRSSPPRIRAAGRGWGWRWSMASSPSWAALRM